jgi:hypothetical protein
MKLAVLKAPRRDVAPKAPAPKMENLSDVLTTIRAMVANGGDGPVTIEDVLNTVGRRAYGPLLLAVGVIGVSPLTAIPGATWAVALITLLIAGQMAFGMTRPWLPATFLRASAPRKALATFIDGALPIAARVDKFVRPRAIFLVRPPFVTLVALCCVAAALITIPLGFVIFAPIVPCLAIVLFGLGMTAHDGMLLTIGVALMAAAAWLATLLWPF